MSFTDDFLKELKKRGLTLEDVTSNKGTGSSTKTSNYTTSYLEELRRKKELQEGMGTIRLSVLDKFKEDEDEDEIAPVLETKKKKDDSRLDFFQKGAFEDGYQKWDVTKTILGTAGDIKLNVAKGALGVVEGIGDLAAYGVAGASKLVGADEFARKTKEFAKTSLVDKVYAKPTDYFNENSVLGNTSDAILQGVGQVGLMIGTGSLGSAAGLSTKVVTGLNSAIMGASSFGSGMGEAYRGGATNKEAVIYGTIAGASDALSELMFGGLGNSINAVGFNVGLSSADDMLAKKVSSMFSKQLTKNLVEFGIKAGAEGFEEVVAGTAQAIGKKMTYLSEEEFSDILHDENLLEQFVVGAVTSGIMQSGAIPGMKEGSLIEANKTGKDFITGYSQNEQAVIKKEVENRIAEKEADGTKLSKKERSAIEAQVEKDMEKGYISIDTIEEALGGETYKTYKHTVDSEDALQKEFDTLNKMKQGEMTGEQMDRRTELKEKLEYLKKNSKRSELKSKLGEEVMSLVKGDRLAESYNERGRKREAFQADLSRYDDQQKAVVQKAVDSGILNNTNRTHEFVDMVAKISADKGVLFDFTNNQKLKESGFSLEGKTINGYVSENGIAVNIQSAKSLNTVVGHEIAHVLEGTDLYTELQTAVTEYAKTKGDYQGRYDALSKLYESVEGANIDAELTADLVGDYLFTDSDFINNLSTKHRNVFQKIYDEVKYLLKVATAGSKEAKELEKVKRAFDKAYRETKNTADSGVKYSISETADGRIAAVVDNDILSNIDTSSWDDAKKAEAKKAASEALKNFSDGIVVDGVTRKVNRQSRREYTRSNDTEKLYNRSPDVFADKMRAAEVADDVVVAATNWSRDGGLKHPRRDNFVDFDHGTTLIVSGNSKYIAEVVVGITDTGDAVFYDVVDMTPTSFDIKKAEPPTTATTQDAIGDIQESSTFDTKVAQKGKGVKRQFSLSDTAGREVSPAVARRFEKSKAVDENGNLKVLYHGTPSGEFTIFDKSKGSVEGDFGSGFYFTDNSTDVSDNYEGGGPDFDNKVARRAEQIEQEEDIDYEEAEERARAELYKGSHKFEVYLNVENPAVVGETMLFDSEHYLEQYNEEDYEDYDEYIADVEQLFADDVENIVWEVEKNVDVYSTDGLADVLYNAYYEGGIGIEELKSRINELYLEDSEGNLVGNEVTRQIIESLGYDGIIDPTVSSKFNMGLDEGTTHYIVFKPNQIKAITNQNPTDNPDIHRSLSADGEKNKSFGNYNVYGEDIALESVQEDIAPAPEAADQAEPSVPQTRVEDLFPDDTAPMQEEYENLLAERDDIRGAMDVFAAVGDTKRAEQLMPEYEAVQARIAEIEADDSDRLASIREEDAPPETDNSPEDVADNVPLTKKLVDDLTRNVRAQLGLSSKRSNEVRELIQRYSNEEFPSKAHLYTEIAEKFGTITESSVDEDLKGIKSLLRTYGINVDESIKSEIADYAQVMRSNFGKVRFSKEGLPVDVAYKEFQEVMPGYFPESIYVPTDQLMRIIEVANMDTTMQTEREIDWQTLEDATDTIMNGVAEFKQNRKETLANQHGRESFNSLMESADQYVPPVSEDIAPVGQTRPAIESVQADPDDIAPVFDTSSGQQSLLPETEAPKKLTRKDLHMDIMDHVKTYFRYHGFEFDDVLKNAKDLSTFATVDNTPQRVMEKALGYKEGQALSNLTVNMVAQNETEGIKWLNSFTDKKSGLLAKISKQYGIKPGSKASAAAQMYAEGFYVGENDAIIAYGDKELAADFPNAKVQENIKKLSRDPRIRQIYDETLEAINKSRTRNAYPEIPRLDNYFLHFRAMEDTFSRLGLPFNPNDIRAKDLPTDLNGVTADLKPGQPYFASAMHRTGKRTSFDLLGGLEKYLTSAKNQIYHIDDIQKLRALRNYVAETYGQATGLQDLDLLSNEEAEQRIEQVYDSHLSTFAKFLNEEANVLAGKTSLIDRGLEGVIGRRGMTFMNTLNRQVGANMVGYNVSSSLTNFLAPVQALAKTNKFDFVKAMAQTSWNKIASIFGGGDGFAEQSPVMIRRNGAEQFYRTPYQKVADAGYVFMSMVDNLSTELIARAKYNEFTRKGMSSNKAHYETDKWVSRLMGDRSLGQQPHIYNSKTLGLVTKFQLEVRNQLDSMFYDTIQDAKVSSEHIQNGLLRNAKKAAKITSTFTQLAVMQHLFGKAFESVAGYNPAFDIIDVLVKTFGWDDEEEDEDTVLDNIEEGFQALLGDLPYTSVLTGGRIPISSALPVTELVKGKDQYGNEKDRWDTVKEAAPYYLLPGGYGQIKKTVAGMKMFDDDLPIAGSYTDSGNLRFPVEDTLQNRVQAGLFGQWASENARDYFENERKPLEEKQIQEFINVDIPIRDYWEYREGLAEHEKMEDKIKYIEGLDLPVGKKNILVNNVADRKTPIDLTDYDQYSGYEEFDFASKNPEKYEFLQRNNISYSDYLADEDSKEFYDGAFTWEKNYPEKVMVSKAVTDSVVEYRQYSAELDAIRADKDKNGKSISGSAKAKKRDYINSLDIDDGAKMILFKNEYNADDTFNYEIIDYLNGRDDISRDEMITILKELSFEVHADGTVTW